LVLSRLTDRVTMIHRRDTLRAQKAIAERTLKNPHIAVQWNTTLEAVRGETKVSSVLLKDVKTGETRELACDAVFFFIGMVPITGLLPDAEKDSTGYIVTDDEMRTSVEGIFAAGDVRAKSFRQVITATSDGALAAHAAASYIDTLQN
ncbi:FAD-dependent oxidoreductase, partial [Treponema pallidum]